MKKVALFLFAGLLASGALAQKSTIKDYNISWTTPGINSLGSIPLGNGDIGLNAWVEENGDLVFYLSKTDTWSENGQLLKLGKIRVSLNPNPFIKESFLQELKLEQGEIVVNYGLSKITLWVDANHPTVQIDIDSKTAINAQVSFETWRKARRQLTGMETHAAYGVLAEQTKGEKCAGAIYQESDTIVSTAKNKVMWYHHNSYSWWKSNLELQSLGEYAKANQDPLLYRTFGALIEAEGLSNKSDTLLTSLKPAEHFQVNIYPLTQVGSSEVWKKKVIDNANKIKKLAAKTRKEAHLKWWKEFWDKSYIYISSKNMEVRKQAELVTQGYILQRFINGCAGRGNFPIKFNGSIFTVDNYHSDDAYKGYDADFRLWGGPFWWQNTRLIYWTMLISGDFEMMKPLFRMYSNNLAIRKLATKKYYGHDGAYFPETMNFWGTFASDNYGCDRTGLADGYTSNNYIRYYWQNGLELSLMMLDYYSFTQSQGFAKDTLVPLVSEVLTFYDKHWNRGNDGKILFSPAMSLETFHKAVNPLPEIVGIKAVAERMLAMKGNLLNEAQQKEYKNLINDLPQIPVRVINNDTILAPAYEYSDKQNYENPELYAVFPYRTFGLGKPNIALAQRTFANRTHKENIGWQQNSIQAAYLGQTDEVERMVIESFSVWNKNFRFPAFWGPNYDWTPDQDHGSVAVNALQRMLIQYENDKIYLIPAWPKEWDVHFKVKGPKNSVIEGIVENGKVVKIKSAPKNIEVVVSE